jgi:hypothetical protein
VTMSSISPRSTSGTGQPRNETKTLVVPVEPTVEIERVHGATWPRRGVL